MDYISFSAYFAQEPPHKKVDEQSWHSPEEIKAYPASEIIAEINGYKLEFIRIPKDYYIIAPNGKNTLLRERTFKAALLKLKAVAS